MNTPAPPRLPTVSVVIPAYNRARYLRQAVDSVLDQDYPDLEVLVVDDGSTDDTPGILASYGPRVHAVTQKNAGPSAARNRGVREAAGELVAFHDSDDLMLPGRLRAQAALFAKNPDLGLASADYLKIGPDGEALGSDRLSLADRLRLASGVCYRNFFATPTVMVRRACLKATGLFAEDLSFGEDWDLWLRLLSRFPARHLPVPLAAIRFHSQSIVATLSPQNFDQWREVIERDHARLAACGRRSQADALRRKRLSVVLFNEAWVLEPKDVKLARRKAVESLRLWPWWRAQRYVALLRSYLAEVM